jgi:hypothetical protein
MSVIGGGAENICSFRVFLSVTQPGPDRILCGCGYMAWCNSPDGDVYEVLAHLLHRGRESHFDEVEIPTSSRQVHPNATAFEVSANYAATRIRFTRIPSGARQVDWHTVPERVLTVRLDGSTEYQTSDGDERHVPAGNFVLFEDTAGNGHKSRHSPEEQTVT